LEGDKLRVNRRISKAGEMHEFFYHIPITDVDTDNLKFLGIWDGLSQELKDTLVRLDNGDVEVAQARMEHARKHRRNKYPGVPDQVVCCNCGKEQKMAPSMIVARAEKIAKEKGIICTPEDYIKGFKCQKCCPTKGRKPSHNLPPKVELKCKCGASVTYPASIALKFAEKKGLTVEAYVKGYECQKCHPTKGRKKGKKVKGKK
jgi:hypothetical protein